MSLRFRLVAADAENAAAQACPGGALRIGVTSDFPSGFAAWRDDGTAIHVPWGRETSTPQELAAGGLTREETTLLFELHNAASRVEFEMLRDQARRGAFADAAPIDLPPVLRPLARQAADAQEILYAMRWELVEHLNLRRSWHLICELPPAARESAAARGMQRLAAMDFANYLSNQIGGGHGHFDRLRQAYRQLRPSSAASTMPHARARRDDSEPA